MADHPSTTEGSYSKSEVLLAALLGIAAIATAFAAFKASLVGDEVISNYNQGIRKVDEASQLYNEGNQYQAQDQQVFLEWIKAIQVGDVDLADYIQQNLMSQELLAGLEWWEQSPDAPTPFVPENPDYFLVQYDEAVALDEEVDAHFAAAAEADDENDQFELVTVLLAIVLFFLGLAGVIKRKGLQNGLMAVGALGLVGSLALLVMLLV